MYVCWSLHVHAVSVHGEGGGREKEIKTYLWGLESLTDPIKMELCMVVCFQMCALGTPLKSSRKAASIFHC